jgi:CRISPR-associated protein Cmr6
MMQCRRDQVQNISVKQAEHAGLWLDKYLSWQLAKNESVATGQSTPQQRLVKECAGIKEPDSYHAFYQRWQATLASYGAQTKEAEVRGRLAIGLGDESVIETAVTLHRTYGVPYIPGSALKGLTASFARRYLNNPAWQPDKEAYKILFGSTQEAGFITFFDALYVPGSGHQGHTLASDVITVHHSAYYQDGAEAPADWDNPNPVSFLSAIGRYLIALSGPSLWVNATFHILELALTEIGVGAKTSSGYGRLYFVNTSGIASESPKAGAVAESANPAQQQIVEQFERQLSALSQHRVAGEIYAYVERWRALEVDKPYKQQVARAIIAKIRDAGREKQSREKKWYQELLASLLEEA